MIIGINRQVIFGDKEDSHIGIVLKSFGVKPPSPLHMSGIQTSQNTQFVRVYNSNNGNANGSWVMRAQDIQGKTAQQIKDMYALEYMPNQICDVNVPSGKQLYTGIAERVTGWGNGGGVQFDLDWNTTGVTFTNSRPLS